MRRGALYARAKRGDITKIALGHHQEDLMESLLMNLFFVGQIRAKWPKVRILLRADSGFCRELTMTYTSSTEA